MRIKIYHVLLMLCALGVISCVRDEFTGKETGAKEELLLQKAKLWYRENVEFAKSNASTGVDVTRFTLDWEHKDFMKNQSGNTIISVPIKSEIPGYKTGVLNFLLTQEGVSLGVYKVYKESTGSTDMAYYSGTGQLIVKGFYNDEKGTFLPDQLGIDVGFRGGGYHDIEEVIIDGPQPQTPIQTPGWEGSNPGNPPGNGFPPYGPGWSSGGGGGNGGNYTVTPCQKTKKIVNDPKLKPKIDSLKIFALTAIKDEIGYQQDTSGNINPAHVNGEHHVDFMIDQNSVGGIHNHTLTGIHMFSPNDIVSLLSFARVQNYTLPAGSTIDNTGNAFVGMISQSGSYYISFNGGSTALPPQMTEAEQNAYLIEMNTAYRKIYKAQLSTEGKTEGDALSDVGLQKLFFDITKQVGLDGKVNLIKENSGNTSTIQQNEAGIPIPKPC